MNVQVPSAVCTLYEGNYHYGVGALTNSLFDFGFRGTIWVGYRGPLPFWAKNLKQAAAYQIMEVAEGCKIHFMELDTNYHLTNYKPTFMLDLWDRFPEQIDGLCYIDPDIVLKREWSFFESWIEEHVALCEDINSPLNATAPKRIIWQKVMKKHQVELPSNLNQYVNGGFVGVTKANRDFVETWQHMLEIVGKETEPLDLSSLPSAKGTTTQRHPTALFFATDQDALNCAAMLHESDLSIANRDAMDFGKFGWVMSHSLGSQNPGI